MDQTKVRAPKVSIVLTSYNHGQFINEAIDSVLQQTFEDFELIILDDASTDNSWEIISSYTDPRIRPYRNSTNIGAVRVTNKAIELSKGKYIAVHHSDDAWFPKKLEKQVQYIEKNPNIGAVFSHALAVDENSLPLNNKNHFYYSIFQQNNRSRHEWLRYFFFSGNALCHPSMLIHKHCYKECGVYDDRLAQLPDFDMWIRLLFKYDIHILQEKLVRFRVRNNEANTSGNRPDTRIRDSFEYFILLKKYLQISEFSELHAIFPEAKAFETKDHGDLLFLLGRTALQEASHPMAQLFALQLVFDALGDASRRKTIENKYHFTCNDLINLTSKYDIFGTEARNIIPNIQRIIADRDDKIAQRDQLLEKLKIALQERNDLLIKSLDQLKDIQKEAQILINNKEKKPEEIDSKSNSSCAIPEQYQQWQILHQPSQADIDFYSLLIEQKETHPTFHIITILTTSNESYLADTIDAIGNQTYTNWRFTVVANYDCPDPLFDEIEQLSWIASKDIDAGLKSAVHNIQANWVGIVPPGTTLDPLFLTKTFLYSANNDHIEAIYYDNDEREPGSVGKNPQFKPDFNPDYLLSTNYIGDVCFFKYTPHLFNLPSKYQRNINLPNILEIFQNSGKDSIFHIDELLYNSTNNSDYSIDENTERKNIILSHLNKRGIDASIQDGIAKNTLTVNYKLNKTPKVSIIIPTKNNAVLIKSCIESIYNKTSYKNFETIIIDNQSTDQTTLAYLDTIAVVHPSIRVIKYNRPFNYSAMNNFAVQETQGEYLVLLNDDTEIIQDTWMERMLQHAQRQEIGAVGAKLVFLDKTIQHAGVVLGMSESADHPGIGQDMLADGYMNRLQVVQNFSAVTAACLMVSKQKYLQVGGLDEDKFKVLFNDVDFCLKLGQAGYLNVWTPHATVIHHGSSSLGKKKTKEEIEKASRRSAEERLALMERWSPLLKRDPFYNRNLSLRYRNWNLDNIYTAPWSTLQPDRLRVAALPNNSEGSTHYRVTAPLQGMRDQGWAWNAVFPDSTKNPAHTMPGIIELARMQVDTFLLHSVLPNLEVLKQQKKYAKAFLVFGVDDMLSQVPKYNPTSKTVPHNINSIMKGLLKVCDRLIVSTEPLFDFYRKKKLIEDIVIVPNAIDECLWSGVTSLKRQDSKPRVGWAGAAQHHGDIQLIHSVIQKTSNDVHWVFLGMCPEAIRPYVHEFHPSVPLQQYPQKLASLNLDLAVAPLENNPFNEAKSNLRLLEYGILGIPVIASDVFPYQKSPAKLVENVETSWIEAIAERIHDLDAAEREGQILQQWVNEQYLLQHTLPLWREALTPRPAA